MIWWDAIFPTLEFQFAQQGWGKAEGKYEPNYNTNFSFNSNRGGVKLKKTKTVIRPKGSGRGGAFAAMLSARRVVIEQEEEDNDEDDGGWR